MNERWQVEVEALNDGKNQLVDYVVHDDESEVARCHNEDEARLIAQAPSLLAACKEALVFCQDGDPAAAAHVLHSALAETEGE